MKNKFILAALLSTSLSAVSLPAGAVIQGGESVQPGNIQKRFEKKSEAKVVNEIVIRDEREQNDVDGAGEIKFDLEGVSIEGNTVFEGSELEEIYAPKVGGQVSLADIYEIRDLITKKYREEGYVLSRAILPPQKISSGEVKFQIIEGRLNDITVQGEVAGDRSIIDGYVNKIRTEGPLNSNNLERYLLLINDLYGTSASGVLRPSSSEAGAADLIIDLAHDDVSGVLVFDNSGTKFVGENIGSAEVSLNSALGQYEKISVRTILDTEIEELKFFDLTYTQPIDDEGTEIRFNVGQAATKPGSTLSSLDITGDTDVFEVEITHPYLRSRRENLTLHSGFTLRNVDSDAAGAAIFKDKTRIITAGATYDIADDFGGVNLFDLTLHRGLGTLGASNDSDLTSRENGSATFTKITGEASREQELADSITLLVAAEGQYSNSALFVGDEFSIGGDFGRGYDFSEFTGDSGIAAKVELQFGFEADNDFFQDYQLYTFYDFGTVWQRNVIAAEEHRSSLSSVGTGVRANLVENVSGYAQLSKPLEGSVASEGNADPRFHFGLNYIF